MIPPLGKRFWPVWHRLAWLTQTGFTAKPNTWRPLGLEPEHQAGSFTLPAARLTTYHDPLAGCAGGAAGAVAQDEVIWPLGIASFQRGPNFAHF